VGPQGPKGETGTVDTSGFYAKDASDARFARVGPSAPQVPSSTALGAAALWLRSTVDTDGSSSTADFKVLNDGGLLAGGDLGSGEIPATGCGVRTMWYPSKGAFRSGSPGECSASATAWDEANVGFYSWAGGFGTTAGGLGSLAFGQRSSATGRSSVAMGDRAVAGGDGAVALGTRVEVTAANAAAIGSYARADYSGALVFGDRSSTDPITATASNQFTARAAGGFRFRTNATTTTGCDLPSGSASFSCTSDRNTKRDVVPATGVLARLSRLPVSTWSYKAEKRGVRHMGPMAQDFRRVFGLGTDAKTIGLLDEAGVSLAAVKELHAKTRRQQRQLDTQAGQIAALERRLDALER
jgi:hypothetical protein